VLVVGVAGLVCCRPTIGQKSMSFWRGLLKAEAQPLQDHRKTYPICFITKQPKAKPKCLYAVRKVRPDYHQSFERNYKNVTNCSQCMITSHIHNSEAKRHSPEKFLDTSMVVKMAPCRRHKCYFSILSRTIIDLERAVMMALIHVSQCIK